MSLPTQTINSRKEASDPGEIREKLDFIVSNKPVDRVSADCIWLGVFSTKAGVELTPPAINVDKISGGCITKVLKSGDFDGALGSTHLLRNIPGIPCIRILLIGCGEKKEFNGKKYVECIKNATNVMKVLKGVKKVGSFLTELPLVEESGAWKIQKHVFTVSDSLYKFERFKTKGKWEAQVSNGKTSAKSNQKKKIKIQSLRMVEMLLPGDMRPNDAKISILQSEALSSGVGMTRDLGNLPPNICTPEYLANTGKKMSKELGLKCEIFDKTAIAKLKMNSFLAVAEGSVKNPYLIVMTYSGGKAKEKPSVLVGKGITFDSGGISIKPSNAMDEMKYDMCGAATVFGAMRAVAEAKLKRNVVGVVVTCENMPSGTATRPGDIVTSMSGQTVEILNTDAEGRLILCDALTFVERFDPKEVIDIATLTGACVIALGSVNTGLFSSNDDLAGRLLDAGKESLDPVWRLPLEEEYQDLIKSPFADMANIGGREAGSVTAACFLWRFAKAYPWAHLDIAGTAWKSGSSKNATGRPVPLLFNLLKDFSD